MIRGQEKPNLGVWRGRRCVDGMEALAVGMGALWLRSYSRARAYLSS